MRAALIAALVLTGCAEATAPRRVACGDHPPVDTPTARAWLRCVEAR